MDGWRDRQIDGQIVTSEDVGGGNKSSLACLSDCKIVCVWGNMFFSFLRLSLELKGRVEGTNAAY